MLRSAALAGLVAVISAQLVGCKDITINDSGQADSAISTAREVKAKADDQFGKLTAPARDFLKKAENLGAQAESLKNQLLESKRDSEEAKTFIDKNLASPAEKAQTEAYALLEQVAKIGPEQWKWAVEQVQGKIDSTTGATQSMWRQLQERLKQSQAH